MQAFVFFLKLKIMKLFKLQQLLLPLVGPLIFASLLIVPILGYRFELGNLRTKFNANYLSNLSIQVVNDSIYVDMFVNRTFVNGFKTHLEFQLRLKNSPNYQTLFAHSVDVCTMVGSMRESILKRWFASLRKYGNFMENCPVPVGHYYIKGWNMDGTLIPAYLYPGDYRIIGHGYYGKYKSKKEEFVVHCELDLTMV